MADNKSVNGPAVLGEAGGDNWKLYLGDSCEVIKGIPDNSIDFGIHSPPFSNLYIYSDSEADMGNSASDEEFIEHYEFLIAEMLRATVTGRLCVVHCKDLPKYANRDGTAGLKDFPGQIINAYCGGEAAELDAALRRLESRSHQALANKDGRRHSRIMDAMLKIREEIRECPASGGGWSYHSRITIWKCPVVERERTNNNGLLHKTVLRDRSQLRQAMADYLIVFRKPPENVLMSDKPICKTTTHVDENGEQVETQHGFEYYVGSSEFDPGKTDKHPSRFARRRGKKTGQEHGHQDSINVWRRYAESVWWDIDQMDVLNYKHSRSDKDERHICPLQLGLIERCVHIWSLPGEIVFSPFAGIGSEGVAAIRQGRKFVGVELKPEYFRDAKKNLNRAKRNAVCDDMPLFSGLDDEGEQAKETAELF